MGRLASICCVAPGGGSSQRMHTTRTETWTGFVFDTSRLSKSSNGTAIWPASIRCAGRSPAARLGVFTCSSRRTVTLTSATRRKSGPPKASTSVTVERGGMTTRTAHVGQDDAAEQYGEAGAGEPGPDPRGPPGTHLVRCHVPGRGTREAPGRLARTPQPVGDLDDLGRGPREPSGPQGDRRAEPPEVRANLRTRQGSHVIQRLGGFVHPHDHTRAASGNALFHRHHGGPRKIHLLLVPGDPGRCESQAAPGAQGGQDRVRLQQRDAQCDLGTRSAAHQAASSFTFPSQIPFPRASGQRS